MTAQLWRDAAQDRDWSGASHTLPFPSRSVRLSLPSLPPSPPPQTLFPRWGPGPSCGGARAHAGGRPAAHASRYGGRVSRGPVSPAEGEAAWERGCPKTCTRPGQV